MTISVRPTQFNRTAISAGSSASIQCAVTPQSGDLLIAIGVSQKIPLTPSAGWTELTQFGLNGGYGRAYWRIADGSSSDQLTVPYLVSGFLELVLGAWRSTVGFDSTAIQQQSGNVSLSSNSTSFALSSALASMSAGQLAVVLGGDSESSNNSQTPGVTGTSWTQDYSQGGNAAAHAAGGSYTTAGVPSVPSISFGTARSNTKFIWAGVIKEITTASALNAGLFFGSR